ncbi:hypothetical protein AMR47_12520 [Leptospira interrogans]|nr:hypothetical protein AMR47_12520 [Leptospira interrogans]
MGYDPVFRRRFLDDSFSWTISLITRFLDLVIAKILFPESIAKSRRGLKWLSIKNSPWLILADNMLI